MLHALVIGFLLGYCGSIPVAGPVSILVFGRGLQDRQQSARYLAAGSALAESVYAYLAFWGFGALLGSVPWIEPITRGAAAIILTVLGLRFAFRPPGNEPSDPDKAPSAGGNKRNFLLGITITALNPTLMATWTVAVTTLPTLGFESFGQDRALPFSFGVCTGIVVWFVTLLWLLGRYKGRFQRSTVERIVRIMGLLLTALGLFFAYRFFSYYAQR